MSTVIQLQSLKSVAATGSVRSAAQHLGLSPSAVSHHLKLLEQDMGLTLFQRHGRGLCLTETGSALMGEVDGVLESSSRLQQRVMDLKDSRVDRLSIGYFSTAGNRWMPELVLFLEHRFPHMAVQLNLDEGAWHEDRSDIQIIITETKDPAFPPEINSSFLLEDPYVVAVPADHELATRKEVSLAEIESYSWIDNDKGEGPCRTILFDACARAGVQVHFKHEAHTFVAALHMVSRGLGITLLPRLGIDQLPEGVAIIPLAAPEPIRYVHALSDLGHPQQSVINDAITALRELASDEAVALA
ncbi:LysR family transcriptional regulator [Brevibacterium sp. UCMA 11754]|uniref:LysR family transcriptional regulator n=1 Tax=Brevibacterium sp. UCMA 11754 TaxID=2749198 RepID=UPI001F268CB7|nr:LysR family transcriptional regulator [Brevibacterium sp. UCMA 11754]MCF2572398.1 LysR family transcriptional regulator [Brevibacterium sp. UCMA 11754]